MRRAEHALAALLRADRSGPARAALLTLVVLVFAMSTTGQAQQWLGPGDVCSADTLLGDWGGLRSRLAKYGVGFGLQEQTELWANLAGGIKQGVEYDGLTTASLCIDMAAATKDRWNARIFASGFQVYGPGPSIPLVGALQLLSGLEATPSTKLYDLWLEQPLFGGKLLVRFGQEGANDEFMLAPYTTLFLNSSFGFPPVLALDLPSGGPNYPLASPFVRVDWLPNDQLTLVSAVFTDDPAPPGEGDPQLRDRHGTAFRLNDHAIGFAELWYSPAFLTDQKLPGTYKLGIWVATGQFADPLRDTNGQSLADPTSNGVALTHSGDHGFYVVANQALWSEGGVFLQFMHAPDNRNLSDLSIAGGVNLTGLIPSRPNDQAGLAFTYVGIGAAARRFSQEVIAFTGFGSPYARGETAIEAVYQVQLKKWLSLQPDLQYVINPGAGIPTQQAPAPLKNALVVGLRLTVNF